MIAVTAQPLQWSHDKQHDQYEDRTYGFCVWNNEDYVLPAFASWDVGAAAAMMQDSEGDQAQFATLKEAQEWCQAQADNWIARHAVVTPSEQPR